MKKVLALSISLTLAGALMIGVSSLLKSIVDIPGHTVFAQEEEIQFNDSDGDNVIDEQDLCPQDPQDQCIIEMDTDGDGSIDEEDLCPQDPQNQCTSERPSAPKESDFIDGPVQDTSVPPPPPNLLISYQDCTTDQMHVIDQSDLHAQIMVDNAINVLASYFPDTGRPEVKEALRTTMGSDDADRAQMALDILQNLKDGVSAGKYQYECEAEQDADDKTLAYTIWCLPFTDIHMNPLWFSEQDIDKRGETLIHEWLHWFSCKLDLGYNVENPGGTKARWNADSPANLVLALYKLK